MHSTGKGGCQFKQGIYPSVSYSQKFTSGFHCLGDPLRNIYVSQQLVLSCARVTANRNLCDASQNLQKKKKKSSLPNTLYCPFCTSIAQQIAS